MANGFVAVSVETKRTQVFYAPLGLRGISVQKVDKQSFFQATGFRGISVQVTPHQGVRNQANTQNFYTK